MTTIACNLKEMAGDSLVTDDDIGTGTRLGMKLWRVRKSVFGVAGEDCSGEGLARYWLEHDYKTHQPPVPDDDWDWHFLELSPQGIFVWDKWMHREQVMEETMAIGSGRKVALYCMRILHMTPAKAVFEASKVDHHTRPPVHTVPLIKPKPGVKKLAAIDCMNALDKCLNCGKLRS